MGVFVSCGATLAASRYGTGKVVFGSYAMYAVDVRISGGGEMMRVVLIGYFCSGVQAGRQEVPHFRGWNRVGFDDDVRGFET